MKATEELKKEHRAIELMLDIMEKVCEKLQAGEKVNADDLEKMVEFIRVFADKCHHSKEEDLLFPALEKAGIPKRGGPLGVMLAEHTTGRSYVTALYEAVTQYKKGNTKAAGRIVENGMGYTRLLRQHIVKEDNILYQMADMHLSEKEQDELVKRFEKIEQERIGPSRHEEFHNLLHRLKETYLK